MIGPFAMCGSVGRVSSCHEAPKCHLSPQCGNCDRSDSTCFCVFRLRTSSRKTHATTSIALARCFLPPRKPAPRQRRHGLSHVILTATHAKNSYVRPYHPRGPWPPFSGPHFDADVGHCPGHRSSIVQALDSLRFASQSAHKSLTGRPHNRPTPDIPRKFAAFKSLQPTGSPAYFGGQSPRPNRSSLHDHRLQSGGLQ